MATFVGSEKCTREGCGHPESDHASGQHRPRFFCEHPDCDCQDFQWAEEMNQPIDDWTVIWTLVAIFAVWFSVKMSSL